MAVKVTLTLTEAETIIYLLGQEARNNRRMIATSPDSEVIKNIYTKLVEEHDTLVNKLSSLTELMRRSELKDKLIISAEVLYDVSLD